MEANPELRELADRVFRTLRVAADKAVAHAAAPDSFPMPADPNSLEQLFLARFQKLQAAKQQAAIKEILPIVTGSAAGRAEHYGDLAGVDLNSAVAVHDQVHALALPETLQETLAHIEHINFQIPHPPEIDVEGLGIQQTKDVLQLRIRKVTCIDETDAFLGSEAGEDEIYLGGTTLDNRAEVLKVDAFKVGDFDEDDNPVVVFSPPRVFAQFDLRKEITMDLAASSWPKVYAGTFLLAEVDEGGLPDELQKLYEAVKGEVISYLTTVLGVSIGSLIGTAAFPGLGTVIGALVGAAVGWAVGKVWELFKSWWEDDLFTPCSVTCTIGSFDSTFSGQSFCPPRSFDRVGHGGEYQVEYDWLVTWKDMETTPDPVPGWSEWTSHGGQLLGVPTARSRQPEITDVFAKWVDNRLWQNSWDHDHWTGWLPHNDGLVVPHGEFVADTMGPNHIHLFVVSEDGDMLQKWWDNGSSRRAPLFLPQSETTSP